MVILIGMIRNNEAFLAALFVFLFLSVSQLFGCGSVAQTVLSKGALGEPLTIHVGFTLGVMMAVYMAGGVSGKRRSHVGFTPVFSRSTDSWLAGQM